MALTNKGLLQAQLKEHDEALGCFEEALLLFESLGERVRVADRSATRRLIGWEPRVQLADGLRRTVEWYRSRPQGG
jgi:nucleoside-diphosphate-sugar epimerase